MILPLIDPGSVSVVLVVDPVSVLVPLQFPGLVFGEIAYPGFSPAFHDAAVVPVRRIAV